MKKLFTTILILAAFAGNGQDTPLSPFRISDTTRLIMLCSDTSATDILVLIDGKATILKASTGSVYWQKGYTVLELDNINDEWVIVKKPVFLDNNRIPLAESIIIWDLKIISPENKPEQSLKYPQRLKIK